jgi:hypothetical protein
MSLTASDLAIYGSANMPENDTTTAGGAIDITTKVIFDSVTLANTLNTAVSASSTLASDTMAIAISGRNSFGSVVGDSITLNGLTAVNGSVTFERLTKIAVPLTHQGTITLMRQTDGVVIGTMESGVCMLRRPFINATAQAAGGSSVYYYEKIFMKNKSSTNALLNALFVETADPSNVVTFGMESGVNGTTTVANRLASPASCSAFNSLAKTIQEGDFNPGSGQGIWLKLTLAAGTEPTKTTYTISASGATT